MTPSTPLRATDAPISPVNPRPHALPLPAVLIPPSRQRATISEEALGELVTSIEAVGLLHPIVVREQGGSYYLVSGERRLSAIKLMAALGKSVRVGGAVYAPGFVPATLLGELSPEQAHEAELEENIRRVDLTLQERALAVQALHSLRRLRNPEHSKRDTAAEAFPAMHPDASFGKVLASLKIAEAIGRVPGVDKAKTEHEAMKLIKRADQADRDRRMAEVVGKQSVTELHEVYNADARDWLADCPDGRFNCILIDPPYGMGAEDFGDAAGRLVGIEHNYSDSEESFRGLMGAIASQLTRVAKAEAHLYVWCDIDGFHFLRGLFEQHGWWCFRTPLVNIKREGGRVPWPEHGPRRCYELVLFAVRGKLPVTAIYRDVFESTLSEGNLGHGAQKPVEAYVELLRRSARPGDAVLDCFAGTGTILLAAHSLRLRAVAVEKDQGAYGMCLKRLEGLE